MIYFKLTCNRNNRIKLLFFLDRSQWFIIGKNQNTRNCFDIIIYKYNNKENYI